MARRWGRGLAAAAAAMLAAVGARAQTVGAGSTLDAAVRAAQAQGLAGEVLAARDGAAVYARAIAAPGRPHRPGERWRWASVSKQVAALLVMQEVAKGSLALDDTLASRLPAFKGPTAGGVTLRMLLQHTSGLPDPDDTPADASGVPAFYRASGPAADPAATALGYCAGAPVGKPGERFRYDNCDTIVLQAVLERATGARFADLVRTRIARPLRLRTLGVFPADPASAPRSVAGVMEDGKAEPAINLGAFGAAGAVYGRPEDLLAFDVALLDGRLLAFGPTAQMWEGDPKLGYVALGAWGFSARLRGCAGMVKLVERRGGIGGVEVRNLLAPDLKRALVVFADRAGLNFGEVWQGRGLTYDLVSAAFCTP